MRKVISIFFIFLLLFNIPLNYAYADAPGKPPAPDMPEWYENEEVKNKKKDVKIPKRPIPQPKNVGHPALNALVNLAMLTPYGEGLYNKGAQTLEDLDYWAYGKIEEYKPLLVEGVLYTGQDLKNTLDSLLNDFNSDHNLLTYKPSNISYNFDQYKNDLNNYELTSEIINAHKITENGYAIRSGYTYYYERSGGYKNRFVEMATYYDLNGELIGHTIVNDLGRRSQQEALADLKNRIGENDSSALEFFRSKMNGKYSFSREGSKVKPPSGTVKIGDNNFNSEVINMGVTDLDGVPHFEYDVKNPYYNPNVEKDPYLNPEYLTYYKPVYNPAGGPDPKPLPEMLPKNLPDTKPEPNPDPEPDPQPDPEPGKNILEKLWDFLKSMLQAILNTLQQILDFLSPILTALLNILQSILDKLANLLDPLFNLLQSLFQNLVTALQPIINLLQNIFNWLDNLIQSLINALQNSLNFLFVPQSLQYKLNNLKENFNNKINVSNLTIIISGFTAEGVCDAKTVSEINVLGVTAPLFDWTYLNDFGRYIKPALASILWLITIRYGYLKIISMIANREGA